MEVGFAPTQYFLRVVCGIVLGGLAVAGMRESKALELSALRRSSLNIPPISAQAPMNSELVLQCDLGVRAASPQVTGSQTCARVIQGSRSLEMVKATVLGNRGSKGSLGFSTCALNAAWDLFCAQALHLDSSHSLPILCDPAEKPQEGAGEVLNL